MAVDWMRVQFRHMAVGQVAVADDFGVRQFGGQCVELRRSPGGAFPLEPFAKRMVTLEQVVAAIGRGLIEDLVGAVSCGGARWRGGDFGHGSRPV